MTDIITILEGSLWQPETDQALKQRIIAEYLKSKEGRSKLAQAITKPLLGGRLPGVRPPAGIIAGSLIQVQQLPPGSGALPIYTKTGADDADEDEEG